MRKQKHEWTVLTTEMPGNGEMVCSYPTGPCLLLTNNSKENNCINNAYDKYIQKQLSKLQMIRQLFI